MGHAIRRLHFNGTPIRNGVDYSVMASHDPDDAYACILLTLRPEPGHGISLHFSPEQAAQLIVQLRMHDYIIADTANSRANIYLGPDGARAVTATLERALRGLARIVMTRRAAQLRAAA